MSAFPETSATLLVKLAAEFGVTRNQVSQAKVRIGRMVEAVEAEMGEDANGNQGIA